MTKMHPIQGPEDRIAGAAAEGCPESRLVMSRRAMMGVTAGLYSWAFAPRFASAASDSSDPRFLVVVLRGGMDGLSVVVPHGDDQYESLRGAIALPSDSTIRLNDFFGLHPSLANFGQMYDDNEAAIVHAACVPLQNRSHFDAQDNLENGMPGLASNSTGWLNRLLNALPKGDPVASHGALQVGSAPLILRGPAPVLGWSPNSFGRLDPTTEYLIRTNFRENDKQLYEFLERGLKADDLAEKVSDDDTGVSALRRGFRGAARLLAWRKGPRIAVLSVDGWDTHSDQGTVQGPLANVLGELDLAIADYKAEAGSSWDNTVMLLVTEFGRTARVNGDFGTDHGVGTIAMLAGGGVNGGNVFADWPGLAPEQLIDGSDLWPTTDLRSVFKGVLNEHLGVPKSLLKTTVFPESEDIDIMEGLVKDPATGISEPVHGATTAAFGAYASRPEPAIARYRRGERVSANYVQSAIDGLPRLPLRAP